MVATGALVRHESIRKREMYRIIVSPYDLVRRGIIEIHSLKPPLKKQPIEPLGYVGYPLLGHPVLGSGFCIIEVSLHFGQNCQRERARGDVICIAFK